MTLFQKYQILPADEKVMILEFRDNKYGAVEAFAINTITGKETMCAYITNREFGVEVELRPSRYTEYLKSVRGAKRFITNDFLDTYYYYLKE